MDKKGDENEDLSLLFQRYGVPNKMIVNGSKEHTLGVLNVRLQRLSVT